MLTAVFRIGCVACFTVVLLMTGVAQGQTSLSIHHRITPSDEQRIEQALDRRGSIDVIDMPLRELVSLLSQRFQENIVVAPKRLEEAAIGLDTPVTAKLDNLPLESILNIVLRELDLVFIVRDNVILITTPDDANSPENLETRVYPARDLLTANDYGSDADPVIEMVTTILAPSSWDEVGGPGSIDYVEATGSLVVSQTWHNHRHLERLLETLRRSNDGSAPVAMSRSLTSAVTSKAASRREAPESRRYLGGVSHSWQLPQLHHD